MRPRGPCAKKRWEIASENACDRACRKCASRFLCREMIFAVPSAAPVSSNRRDSIRWNRTPFSSHALTRTQPRQFGSQFASLGAQPPRAESKKRRSRQYRQRRRNRSRTIERVPLRMDRAFSRLLLQSPQHVAPRLILPMRRTTAKHRTLTLDVAISYDVCFGERDSGLQSFFCIFHCRFPFQEDCLPTLHARYNRPMNDPASGSSPTPTPHREPILFAAETPSANSAAEGVRS